MRGFNNIFKDAYHYVLAWYAHDAVGNVQQKDRIHLNNNNNLKK